MIRAVTEVPFTVGRFRILAVTFLLTVPTVFVGFHADDWVLINRLQEQSEVTFPNAYDLAPNKDPGEQFNGKRSCCLPWWSHPEIKILFFRPLTSKALDMLRRIAPEMPEIWHAIQVSFFLLCIVLIASIYRRLLPSNHSTLASTLMFALCGKSALSIAWIAQLNHLLAFLVFLTGLTVYLSMHQTKPWLASFAMLVSAVVASAAGEIWLNMLPCLFLYELFLAKHNRFLPAIPPLIYGMAYIIAYKALGFGAANSQIYLSPFSDTLTFLSEGAARLIILLSSTWLGLTADPWILGEPFISILLFVSIATLIAFLGYFWGIFQQADKDDKALVAFSLGSSFLSIIPVVTVFPMDRLSMIPFFFAAPGLWLIFRHGISSKRKIIRGTTYLFIFLHFVAAPLGYWKYIGFIGIKANNDRAIFASAPDLSGKSTAYMLGFANAEVGAYWPYYNLVSGKAAPNTHLLSAAAYAVKYEMISENQLQLTSDRDLMGALFEKLMGKHPNIDFLGKIDKKDFYAEVLTYGDQGPRKVLFTFSRPIADQEVGFFYTSSTKIVEVDFLKTPVVEISGILGSAPEP
jgi:hypothetical protein